MFELGLNTRLNPGKHRSAKLRLILVGTVSMGIQGIRQPELKNSGFFIISILQAK